MEEGLEKERFCIGLDVSVSIWYERREQVGAFRGPYTLPLLFRLLQIGNGHGSPERAWLLRPVWRLTTIRRGYCRSNFHRFLLFGRHSCKMILPHRCLHPPLDPTDHNIKVSRIPTDCRSLVRLDLARVALFLRAGMPNVVRNEEDKIIRRIAKLQRFSYQTVSTSHRERKSGRLWRRVRR